MPVGARSSERKEHIVAEVGNAAAGGGVLVAPGASGGAAPPRTDGGGQRATNAGGGPSTVGNKEKPQPSGLTYHGQPETLNDGTQVQRATNSAGNGIREERMPDGRVHTTETTPDGDVVSETWTDPTTGTSRTVDTHGDGRTTTTRTWSDGTKDVTNTEPGQPERTEVYDSSGSNVRTVTRYPDGRVEAADATTGSVSAWNPDAPPTMYGDPIDPAHTVAP